MKYSVQYNPSGCFHSFDTDTRWLSAGQECHGDSRALESGLRDDTVELRAQRVAGTIHGGGAGSNVVQSSAGRAILGHNCWDTEER